MKRLQQHLFGKRVISFLLAASFLCSTVAPVTAYALEEDGNSVQKMMDDLNDLDGKNLPDGQGTAGDQETPDGQVSVGDQEPPGGQGTVGDQETPDGQVSVGNQGTPGGQGQEETPASNAYLLPAEESATDTYWVMGGEQGPAFSFAWSGDTAETIALSVTFPAGMILSLGDLGENSQWTLDTGTVKYDGIEVATLTADTGATLTITGGTYTEDASSPAVLNLTFTCTLSEAGENTGDTQEDTTAGVQLLGNTSSTITFQFKAGVLNGDSCQLQPNGENYDYGTLGFTATVGESMPVSQNLCVVPAADTTQVTDQQGTAQYVVGYLDHQGKAIARQQTAPAFTLTYTVMEGDAPVADIPEALKQAVLAAFGEGVTALPAPTVTSDTSTYTAKAENLPTAIWLANGQGGGTTYTIDWSISRQDVNYDKYTGYAKNALATAGISTALPADYYYVQAEQQGYEPSKSVTIDGYAALEHKVYWADNNNETQARPASLVALYELQFALDGSSDYKTLTEGDLPALGMTTVPSLTGNIGTTYEMTLEAPAYTLPASITYTYYDTEGDAPDTETHTVSWKLVMKDTANYQRVEVTEENKDQYPSVQGKLGTYYVLLYTYEFTLQLRRGGTALGAGLREAFLQGFDLNIDYETGEMQRTLAELNEEGSVTLDYDQTDAHPDTVHVSIANGWRYNLDNRLIAYVVKQNGDSGESGKLHPKATAGAENAIPADDWFAVSYDNSAVPNHGTATDGVYSGGTLYLTLAGETQYKATKIWLDEGPETRPTENVEVELWRYTQRNDRNYNNAAPVRDEGGNILKIELKGKNLGEGEYEEEIVFTDDSTGEPITLPKYDPEGYLYIYGAREYLTGNYEQVFGKPSVGPDAATPQLDVVFKDVLPEGVSSRASGDTFVYNGGTLCNRIVGSTTMSVTKQWKAAAFQSEFEGVEVTFALQAKLKNDEDGAYQTTDNTLSMGDFYAENLTYTDSMTVSKYDDLGHELTYQWIEQDVIQNGNPVPSATKTTGIRTFTLVQAGRKVEYTSTSTTDAADPTHTTIVNEISNVIEYAVEKRWEQGTEPKKVSFTLFRTVNGSDFEPYLKFTMAPDGDEVKVEITDGPKDVYVSDVQSETPTGDDVALWKAVLKNIPEFDEDGNQYEYMLLEDSGTGYSATSITTERDETTGNYTSVVVNGPGDGNVILVTKQWIDESDVQHRLPVTVTIYKRSDNTEVDTVTLGDNGNWYKLVGIGDLDPKDVYVLETKVGDTVLVTEDPQAPVEYDDNESGNTPYTRVQYSTDHHKYEATYTSEEILGHTAYNVINRRLGQIDVTVNVTWKDGDGTARQTLADALEDAGLSFALQLNFDDSAQVDEHSEYNITNSWPNGVDTVTLTGVGGEVTIKDKEGNPASSVQALDLNTATNTQTIKFCDLPKYNATGGAVRYTVAPVFADNNSNATYTLAGLKKYVADLPAGTDKEKLQAVLDAYSEYAETYGEWTYTVGEKHAEDEQELDITYRLSDTVDLTWYCRWKDAYVYENGERPDLYLDIYRVANGRLEPHVINYRWTYEEPEGSSSPLVNEKTFWQATVANMPKYDYEGYEYTYYAIERTDVVAADFSYLPAKYGKGQDSMGSNVFGSRTEAPTTHAYLVCEVQTGATTEYALQAGNTFINTISGNITVEGRKYWQDLPAGYPAADLPGVTFTLKGTSTYEPGNDSSGTSPETITATLTVTKDQWEDMNGVYQLKLAYVGKNKLVIDGDGTVSAAYDDAGTETPLPRFDSEGYLYEYEITSEDIQFENSDITDDRWVYDIETAGFLTKGNVYNTYDPETGILTAVKYLKIQNDLAAYPSVALKLTRTYTTNAGTSKAETVETQVWRAADIQQEVADASGTGEVVVSHAFTFEDLPKYAPNGSEYIYTITEDNTYLGGYASAAYDKDDAPADGDARETAFDDLATSGTQGNLFVGGLKPHDDSVTDYDATFLNVRKTTQEDVSLTIQKQWNDWDDVFGVRPDEIAITIYRYTNTPPYQGQAEKEQVLVVGSTTYENYLWNGTQEDWQLEITGLERYAPNGMPWKYKVKETSTDQYYTVTGNNAVSGTPDVNGNVTISGLTNSMQTSVSFKKQWVDSQGNSITADSLGGLQLSVDFKLQVREDGTGTWQDAETYFKGELSQGDYDKVFGAYSFTRTLTDVLGGTEWKNSKSFATLPKAIKKNDVMTKLSYRVVESEIRVYAANATLGTDNPLMTQTVTVTNDATGNSYTYEFSNGLFSPYYGSETATSHTNAETTHWNRLETTDLTVTKTWADDHSNIYGTRPEGNATGNKTWAVTFVIQRSTDGGANWTNVKDANGNDRTVTLMGIDNDVPVQETVTGLPRSILDATGKVVTCTYRARELGDDGKVIETSGTAVYQDVYTVQYDESKPGAVTNRLRTTQFTAEKEWIIDDNSAKPEITLELQYLASDGKTWKSFDTPAKVVLDGEADENPAKPYYETSTNDKWTAIWDDVPLVLPGSELDASGYTQYRVVEAAVNGYVTTYKTEGTNTVFTNTKLVNIDVDVTKIWVDADNAMGDRPASVTFVLYADGKATTHELTLTASTGLAGLWNRLTGKSNTWTGKFTGLPKYDSTDGHEIVYTVQEKTVPSGYVATVGQDGLTVTNTRNGNLLVEKTVTGSDGETHRTFHFTVELSDKTVNGVHGGVTFTNGVASFGLKSGDKVLIENLPVGCTYLVTEEEANTDGYTTVSQGAAGKIEAGRTAEAQIENHRDAVPKATPTPTPGPEGETTGTTGGIRLPATGDDANLTALYVLLGLSAAGLIALAGYGMYRRKKGR